MHEIKDHRPWHHFLVFAIETLELIDDSVGYLFLPAVVEFFLTISIIIPFKKFHTSPLFKHPWGQYLQDVWSNVDICGHRGKSWDDSDASVWAEELAQGGERNHSAPRQSRSPASTSWVGALADRMVHLWPIAPPLTRPLQGCAFTW